MARRAAGDRIYGPYKHGRKWRVVTKSGRVQAAQSFETEAEARRVAKELREALQVRTVEQAVAAYLEYLRVDKARPDVTINTLRNSVDRIIRPAHTHALRNLGPARAAELYRQVATSGEYRPDTHQNSLRDCRSAWKWMVKRGWIDRNPWADVEPMGQRTKGKKQLRRDEARQLMAWCVDHLGEDRAVVTLLCLLVAIRVGEVVALTGRDIDDSGRLLWVERGKTRNARRSLEVPGPLQAVLAGRARATGAAGRLFPYSRGWPSWCVTEVCAAAGVTVVRGHALRGTHATLATQAGATSHMVAAALGHGSTAVTEQHYTSRESLDGARQARAIAALSAGNGSESVVVDDSNEAE